MRKLTKEHITRKQELAKQLEEVGADLIKEIRSFNALLEERSESIDSLTQRYNEVIGGANALIEEIHEEQESYADERSDTWRDGDAGQAHGDWAGEWSISLDEIDVELPDVVDEPELSAAETLRDLPEQP
jgi:chromosome segregation ATPase